MDRLVHLELLVEPGAEPIAGRLKVDGEPDVAFSGYLEFMALVERLVAKTAAPEPP